MDLSSIDMKLFQEFMQFRAFKAAAEAKEAQEKKDREPSRERGATIGQAEDPADTREGEHDAPNEARERSPTVGRSSDPAEVNQDVVATPLPSPRPKIKKNKGKDRAKEPAHNKTTLPVSEDEQDGLEHTSTPRAFRKQDKLGKNASKPATENRKRKDPPGPEPGPSKRQCSATPPPVKPKVVHPYDTCPTSYELRNKQRGGRVKIIVDGKEEIARTPMERLVHRKAKYKHVLKHGHLFGDKHGCYFNPYSKSPVNEKNCKRIEKPAGFQVGRGGPNVWPWHWEIGLRDDYDLAMDIRGVARKALMTFRPKTLDLKPGKKLTYKNYGSKERTKINDYMYDHFGFLFHFRLESGEDSWAIDAICTGYLASNSAYTQAGKNPKAKLYLKRNASGPGGEDDDSDEEPDKGEDDDSDNSGYEDDYGLNARRHAKNTQTTSKSKPSTSRPSTTKSTTKKRSNKGYGDSRSTKKQKGHGYGNETEVEAEVDNDSDGDGDSEDSSDPDSLPPKPTAADIRKANKVVALEKARDKALGASRDKVGAKPAAAPKGKGKGKERESSSVASKPKNAKRKEVSVDDDDDDEPIQFVSKTIRLSSSEPELEPAPKKASKNASKNASKSGSKPATKPATKSASKTTTRKEPSLSDEEEEPQWKPAKRPKVKPIPPPEPEEDEPEEDESEEDGPEGDGDGEGDGEGDGAEQEVEQELAALPESLVPELTRQLATGDSARNQKDHKARCYSALFHSIYPYTNDLIQGGNGDGGAKSSRIPEKQAGSSKKSTTQSVGAAAHLSTEELVQSGKARAVGTLALKKKPPVPASDRTLRHR